MPTAIIAALLSQWGLASKPPPQQSAGGRSSLTGFSSILKNRSAVSCLLCFVLTMVGFQAVLLYMASFLRQTFKLTTGVTSLIILGTSMFYTLGSLASGRLVRRLGRKRTVVLVNLLSSVCLVAYMNLSSFLPVMLFFYVSALFSGAGFAAYQSLIVEQVPEYRGTVMSLTSAATSLGTALGAANGGCHTPQLQLWCTRDRARRSRDRIRGHSAAAGLRPDQDHGRRVKVFSERALGTETSKATGASAKLTFPKMKSAQAFSSERCRFSLKPKPSRVCKGPSL